MAGTSYILMRWWWCLLCTRPTGWLVIFQTHSNKSAVPTCLFTRTHPDFESLLLLLKAACSAGSNRTNFIVFGLTQSGFEPTIYRSRGKHAIHYTIDAVLLIKLYVIKFVKAGQQFSLETPVSSSSKTDHNNKTVEIPLKVTLNTISQLTNNTYILKYVDIHSISKTS